jgi:hypothetical protein
MPWRSLLVWTLPVLVFAWLAVAGRAASGHSAITPAGSLLGGGVVGEGFTPRASYDLWNARLRLDPLGRSDLTHGR